MTKDVKNILTVSAVLCALVAGYFFVIQPILENNAMSQKYKGDDLSNYMSDSKSVFTPGVMDAVNRIVVDDYIESPQFQNSKYLDPSVEKVKYL
jgi:hypothetical protein